MPLILSGNVGSATAATGFNVANSVRFDRGSSPTMIRTIPDDASSTGSRVKWTFSTWIKRSSLGTLQALFGSYQSANYHTFIGFNTSDQLDVFDQYNGSKNGQRITNRVFRDVGAFYHLCIIWDKDNGTDALKIRIFVNGLEESSFATSSVPGNATTMGADNQDYSIGKQEGVGNYLDAYLCETVFQDNVAQNPVDALGEFDGDSAIFKPIDPSGVTFGTNGFYLDFEDSSNLGNDANGGTDYTETNIAATDQSTDTCTNNAATLNPLHNFYAGATFAEGNLKVTTVAGKYQPLLSTIGVSSGKWYAEFKATTVTNYTMVGVTGTQATAAADELGNYADGYAYSGGSSASGALRNNNGDASFSTTYEDGDIIGIYLDLDNNKLYFAENGTLVSGTGLSIVAPASTSSGMYFFAVGNYSGSQTPVWEANFISAPYSISSGNTDGEFGNFEYSTTITGDGASKTFKALCTKNLAEFG